MTYAGIIFDLDGTLIDTESIMLKAGQTALDTFGLTLSEALFIRLIGTDGKTGRAIMQAEFGDLDFDRLDTMWNDETKRLCAKGIPIKPGVHELISQIDALGLPKAIATSSGRDSAHRKLGLTGLSTHFETLVTRDCVVRPKPAPEPYLLAASRLGLAPETCLAFEDSDPGARAARAAGMTVVQVIDLAPSTGPDAHHLVETLLEGASRAGLIQQDQSRA